MNKNISILLFLFAACLTGYSQSVTTDPASFTPDDEVTITVNVSNTGLAGYADDVYIWTWVANDDAGNTYKGPDAPTNSNPAGPAQAAAKMTRSGDNPNVYSITFVPTAFYGVGSTEIPKIGFLLKGRDWSNGQTSDFFIDVQPPVFDSPVVRIFPVQFAADDVVSIFYDVNLEEDEAMKSAGEYYLYTTIEGVDANGEALNSDDYVLPINAKTKLVSVGNGVYRITFLPNRFYDLNGGDVIKKIFYRVQNADGSLSNPPSGFDILNVVVRQRVN